jgi:hypothetical protein
VHRWQALLPVYHKYLHRQEPIHHHESTLQQGRVSLLLVGGRTIWIDISPVGPPGIVRFSISAESFLTE